LAREFLSSHRATDAAVNNAIARADVQRRRLESILHDLSEGVIVCNLRHQLLLYNRVALWLFSGAGEIGIGWSVESLMDMGPVEKALFTLQNASTGSRENPGDEATVSLPCRLLNGSGVLDSRMSLTYDGDGRADGYVLTLSAGSDPLDAAAPSARDNFYDFDLFHRPLNSGFSNEANLRDFGYVVFDSETTGLRPSGGDKLVSLAAVRVVNGRVLRSETFNSLVNPGRAIPPSAIRVHGITEEAVAEAPGVKEVLLRFQQFCADAILVAHNAAFDMKFLETTGAELDIRFGNPIFDTMLLSMGLHDHAVGHALETVANRFGVEIPPGQRHTALGNALVTADIFVCQLGMLEGRGIHTLADAIAFLEKQNNRRRQTRY
jgi:DNA polymerase-3 subunit epsilon